MFEFLRRPEVIHGAPGSRPVEILFLTHNRLNFTRITLPALLESSDTPFSVVVVDNASTDGTVDYLRCLTHKNLKRVVLNRTNQGLVAPTKRFWKSSRAEFVGKIDNDILVRHGWIEKLVDAHGRVPELGFAAYCHFREDDADDDSVRPTVSMLNGVNMRLQPWIGGNYLAKRRMIVENPGYHQSYRGLRKRVLHGFGQYQIKLAAKGYLHGYVCDERCSLLRWEHLDDPRSAHYIADERHASIRGLTADQIVEWYRRDGKKWLIEYRHPLHCMPLTQQQPRH